MIHSPISKCAWLSLALLFSSAVHEARAATIVHYLLIQADFDSSAAGLETSKFKVSYDSSIASPPLTGFDLLTAVFGAPVVSGSPVQYAFYNTSDSDLGVRYQYYGGSLGYAVSQFFINGLDGPAAASEYPYEYWNYLVAGGSGANSGTFASDGEWIYSENDGAATRNLANGSFDAWTYGSAYPDYIDVTGSENLPVASSNFSDVDQLLFTTAGGISVYAAPEPSRTLLLFAALSVALFRRRRVE